MIIDLLANADRYRALSPRIAKAFDYLQQTDFGQTPDGKIELDGDKLFAMVQRYTARPETPDSIWESHRNYTDIQLVVKGSEKMGVNPLSLSKPKAEFDAERDFLSHHPGPDFVHFSDGMFAIYTPDDVHAPGLEASPGAGGDVLKVVVKVAIEGDNPFGA